MYWTKRTFWIKATSCRFANLALPQVLSTHLHKPLSWYKCVTWYDPSYRVRWSSLIYTVWNRALDTADLLVEIQKAGSSFNCRIPEAKFLAEKSEVLQSQHHLRITKRYQQMSTDVNSTAESLDHVDHLDLVLWSWIEVASPTGKMILQSNWITILHHFWSLLLISNILHMPSDMWARHKATSDIGVHVRQFIANCTDGLVRMLQ